MATSVEDNAEIVRRGAFPSPPADPIGPPTHWKGKAHQKIDGARVRKALFDQSLRNARGPDRLNFSTLRLL